MAETTERLSEDELASAVAYALTEWGEHEDCDEELAGCDSEHGLDGWLTHDHGLELRLANGQRFMLIVKDVTR